MKKVLKQILTLSLIFIMVLSALPVQAAKSDDYKNGSAVSIKGGAGLKIMTTVVNDKTGQVEHLLLWFK